MPNSLKIIVIILFVGGGTFFVFKSVKTWHQETLDVALEGERNEWEKKSSELENIIITQQEELDTLKAEPPISEKAVEVFGEQIKKKDVEQSVTPFDCKDIVKPINALFNYFDSKDYILAYNLEGGTRRLFNDVIKRLTENRPRITDEMKDFLSLIHNIAHLYRILGKQDIDIIRDILENEGDIIEPMMESFYDWFTGVRKCPEQTRDCPSLGVMYDYSGYLLSTMAGRGYLYRRDSKVRALATYYAIRVLDLANNEKLNVNGIDIRPHIESAYNTISNHSSLMNQARYLSTLEALKVKYNI